MNFKSRTYRTDNTDKSVEIETINNIKVLQFFKKWQQQRVGRVSRRASTCQNLISLGELKSSRTIVRGVEDEESHVQQRHVAIHFQYHA